LEGEGRGKVATYPKGAAPPKRPDIADPREVNPLKLYPKAWLKSLPHVSKKIAQQDGVSIIKYSKDMARLLTRNKRAKAGSYVKVKTGETWSGELRRMVPTYKWVYVDPQVIYALANAGKDPAYYNDPRRLLAAARLLYRFGFMNTYRRLVKFMTQRTEEIRREQTDAWRKWARDYNEWARGVMGDYHRDRGRWNVS
jgi:hypothetical protein